MFDELAQQYFSSPEEFAAALKLLQRFKEAEIRYPSCSEFEANFLDNLDNVTGCDTWLLNKVIDYDAAKKLAVGAPSDFSPEAESRILEAIRNQHKAHINSIPISQAFDAFIDAKKQNWKGDDNETHYRRDIFALFHELVGDIKTGDLTKDHAGLYAKAVLHLPANRNKVKRYREHTVQELMEMDIPEEAQFGARNRQKYLQRLSGFLQWLQDLDYAVGDIHVPLQGVISDESIEHEERNPYTCDDLRKLFNSKAYTQGLHDHPFKFWVPVIGLYTGARENEICQLHLCDIYQDDETGIWVFDINQDDAKTTKKSIKKGLHARLVPIHPHLIQLGLLDFIECVRAQGHTRLFPELPYRGKNKYADKVQRWFNRTYTNRTHCCIETPDTSFHSLRHTLITYLSNKLDMPPHRIAVMMGQKPDGGVTVTRYIKPVELNDRHNYLKKVNFKDCFDLNAIRPWRRHKFAK